MDDPGSLIFNIVLLFVLILVNAFFAMSEIAIISLNDNMIDKQAEEGNKKAQNKASQNAFGMDIDELETARDMLEKTFRESERQTKLAEKGGRVDGKGTIPQPPDGDSSLYTKEPFQAITLCVLMFRLPYLLSAGEKVNRPYGV